MHNRLGENAAKVNKRAGELFADNIGMLMSTRGMRSDNALAELAHVDQKTIWRIRRRQQSPTLDMVEKIAGVFELNAWEIIGPGLDRRKR